MEWKRRAAGLPEVLLLFAKYTAAVPVKKGITADRMRISTRNMLKYPQWNFHSNEASVLF